MMPTKKELLSCAEYLLLLLEVPDGVSLEETLDMVLIDLQIRIVDSGSRNAVADVLMEQVFSVLMQTFTDHGEELNREYAAELSAYYRVFELPTEAPVKLPRPANIVSKLGQMQGEFACERSYRDWILYFQRYRAYCEMLSKRGSAHMKLELRRLVLPHLAHQCSEAEGLSEKESRAITIARTLLCMGPKEVGHALLLLNTCRGKLFGFVPDHVTIMDEAELRTVFGVLCEVIRMAPAEFYLRLAATMERTILRRLAQRKTKKSPIDYQSVMHGIRAERHQMEEDHEPVTPEIAGLLKLHHYYIKMLCGDGQPEWDEL